jgi:glycine/D-amino acid oxidase-like deaminating enzyme
VIRKVLFWLPADSRYDVENGNSTFFFETPVGQFYGFPRIDQRSIKLGEHTGGELVDDPLNVDRNLSTDDWPRVREFVGEFMPELKLPPLHHAVCMYTKSPDCHFCIDTHPNWPNVVIGAGFSGHGFKFTTVLGQAMADLALAGKTDLPVGFLRARRWD